MQQHFFLHLKMKIVATIKMTASAEHTSIVINAVAGTLDSTVKGKERKQNVHEQSVWCM